MKNFMFTLQLILGITLSLCIFTAHSQEFSPPEGKLAASYFQSIRDNFAKSKEFSGTWIANAQREALLKTYSEEKPQAFIQGAKVWLDKCPVDAKVHLMLASLLLRTGDYRSGAYHRSMFYGLLWSILASGDGKTPKTAFHVIASDEEYTVLNFIGAKLKQQNLQGVNDVMEVELDGKVSVMYFDVSIGLGSLEKKLTQ